MSEVRLSHLNEWLAQHEGRLRNTSYNRYVGLLKQLFRITVADRMISDSPPALRLELVRVDAPQKTGT